jgi:hypothetical protein
MTTIHKAGLTILLLLCGLASSSCAALQPLSSTGPRGNEATYPILLTEDSHRRDAMIAALNRLSQRSGNSSAIELQPQLHPITATISSLPPAASTSLLLPKVGAAAVMNEEETRESLRRFINESQELIGADPSDLSLVERVDQPDGIKLANYEQRPFRYPIHGTYGKLQIRFRSDRRVVGLSSTCIPDSDRIQTAFATLGARPKAAETLQNIRTNGLTLIDAQGNKLATKIPGTDFSPLGLVVYIRTASNNPDTLEFHLAWELKLSNAPAKMAYVDAISGETVGVE